jgi:hypothetical protein
MGHVMEINKLAEVLNIQVKSFKAMASCLENETRAMTDINLEEMANLNKQKEEIAAKIESDTKLLMAAMKSVAEKHGLVSDIPLSELAAALRKKGNLEIPRLYSELKALADSNRRLLSVNREIAEKFAESVGTTIDLLTRVVNQSNFYGSSGGYQQRPTGSVLINREA